jgi:enamine deaminase RidA (YjgF/YER057c/UK114 family)
VRTAPSAVANGSNIRTRHRQEQPVVIVPHNPPQLFPPYRDYVHGAEIVDGTRLLFISGLNGFEPDGTTMPQPFEAQAALIWRHIREILAAAKMDITNLVSLRTFLADPADDEANAAMRAEQLGSHRVASTVVCCRLLDPRWKLEIEAVAAA